jgi:hypothetical protein
MSVEEYRTGKDLFVVAEKGTPALNTPVFSMADGSDAVAVFLTASSAQQYIDDAAWAETDTVAQLTPSAVIEWLVQAKRDGVETVAIGPNRESQENREPLPTVQIDEVLRDLGESAVNELVQSRRSSQTVLVSYTTYQCLECSGAERKLTGRPVPRCHGKEMVFLQNDTQPQAVKSI